VLAECDRLLEQRAPGRIVLLRSFDMHWRLHEGSLDGGGEIEAVAEEVADAIDRRARANAGAPPGEEGIAVFDNEVAWHGAHLLAVARGASRKAWYFARLEAEGEPPGALGRHENVAVAREVVLRLAREGALPEVLRGLSSRAVEALARVVCPEEHGSDEGHGDRLSRDASGPASHPVRAAQILAFVQGAPLGPRPAPRDRRLPLPGSHGPGEERHGEATPPVDSAPASAVQPRATEAQEARASAPGKDVHSGAITTDGDRRDAVLRTSFGGLFYLLNPGLELGVGEALWKACLPVNAVLGRVAELWLGPEGAADSARALFAGTSDAYACAPVSHEAQREIAATLLESLVAALSRRQLAALPVASVGLTGTRDQRCIVVTSGAFVLFAAPATSPTEATASLSAFLARWPRSAPEPLGPPAIAELDPSGRVVAARSRPSPSLPSADTIGEQLLLAQVAGVTSHLFAARLRHDPGLDFPELRARYLAVPAEIALAEASMCVSIPMESVDLDVRRSGLDRDPGWVPWLRRTVRFEFVESIA
jgi:hypothetical protein